MSSSPSDDSIDADAETDPPPPVADWAEDDNIGPDNFKNDDNSPPIPADAPPPPPLASPFSSCPAPPLPDEPPRNEPLKLLIFEVIAEIFGEITALMRLWKSVIGGGTSILCCLFLIMLV